MTKYIPYYYKLLFTTFITLTIISCQDKTDFALTQDETSWLKQNEGKIEVLFGYQ